MPRIAHYSLVAVLAAIAVAQDSDAFGAALASAQTAATRGNYKVALDQLDAALLAHAKQDYVRVKRVEIEALHKTCTFRVAHPSPDPKTLVAGELLSFDLTTGALKVRYKANQEGDFDRENGLLYHKARFAGPHTIEWKGRAYPRVFGTTASGPIAFVCIGDQGAYRVVFGLAPETRGNTEQWVPSRIDFVLDQRKTEIAVKENSPCRPSKPFTLSVRVGDTSIAAHYNGGALLTGKKARGEYGALAFGGIPFDVCTIEGKAEPAWLQGLIDKALQDKLAAFEKTYDRTKGLPAWLFAPREVAAEQVDGFDLYPNNGFTEVQLANLKQAEDLLNAGKLAQGRTFVAGLRNAELPRATRLVLAALFGLRLGRFDEALKHCDGVLALAPESTMALSVRAHTLLGVGRGDEAITAWQDLVAKHPQRVDFHVGTASAQLQLGRLSDAKATVEAAMGRRLHSDDLDRINRTLAKAQNGPDWPKTFVHRSANFEVTTDIDQKTCREAALILEQSFLAYVDGLTKIKDTESKRFRVFLFSGEAGYKRYIDDVLGGEMPIHTAGIYSRTLKQLLIWNLPDRDAMMRTVRHEGFHQYLDRVMRDPPTWFNEGMAEYYETARYVENRWRIGGVRDDHIKSIAIFRHPAPLDEFLDLDAEGFYAKSQLYYAQSWAFVHFLRHSTPANLKLFEALWGKLVAGADRETAVREVFAVEGRAALAREFGDYVGAMRKK